jgi:hypothetical protein
MSEEDVRGGLRDAVADEPPLVLDTEALVATARQQVTRRRALVAVGAATCAIVVAAVAIPLALGRGTTTTTQVGEQPASTAPPQSSTSEAAPTTYGQKELRARGQEMRAHLKDVLPSVLPEATQVTVGEFGGEATGDFYDGQTNINNAINFTMDGSRFSVVISMWVPEVEETSLADLCTTEDPCQELGTHDGGPVRTRTELNGERMITTVYHFRTSGAVVSAAGYNYDLTGDTGGVSSSTPPVTLDQLTTLATDPELGL